jgi:hypothetical protein
LQAMFRGTLWIRSWSIRREGAFWRKDVVGWRLVCWSFSRVVCGTF